MGEMLVLAAVLILSILWITLMVYTARENRRADERIREHDRVYQSWLSDLESLCRRIHNRSIDPKDVKEELDAIDRKHGYDKDRGLDSVAHNAELKKGRKEE